MSQLRSLSSLSIPDFIPKSTSTTLYPFPEDKKAFCVETCSIWFVGKSVFLRFSNCSSGSMQRSVIIPLIVPCSLIFLVKLRVSIPEIPGMLSSFNTSSKLYSVLKLEGFLQTSLAISPLILGLIVSKSSLLIP